MGSFTKCFPRYSFFPSFLLEQRFEVFIVYIQTMCMRTLKCDFLKCVLILLMEKKKRKQEVNTFNI